MKKWVKPAIRPTDFAAAMTVKPPSCACQCQGGAGAGSGI